jgi:hypothetical protein
VLDDLPEHRPDTLPKGLPLREADGNSIVTKLDDGLYMLYAHLQAKSIKVKEGDKAKRVDAKKLVTLHRAGLLRYVHPPTPETGGLRDLLRCRDDLRCARIAARHRVLKALLRHGHVFRDGKTAWTQKHRRWINAQRLPDALAQLALEQMLIHLAGIERQLDALDAQLEQIACLHRSSDTPDGCVGRAGDAVRGGGSALEGRARARGRSRGLASDIVDEVPGPAVVAWQEGLALENTLRLAEELGMLEGTSGADKLQVMPPHGDQARFGANVPPQRWFQKSTS